ncbi:FABP family protein [Aquipuribacter sp. SD81]|uniref:FABP family protein n=1 Tax=Aquipuribacter sp. SD81 TaxID=3127703 RepID=UPI0030189ED3
MSPARPIEIPADLARPLVAVGWLVGTWQGAGEVTYPTMDRAVPFGQEVRVTHDGRPFLRWDSRTWQLDEAGALGQPLATETGFWRVPGGEAGVDGTDVELLLVHPMGYLEQYLGRAHAGKIELSTELVARSTDAAEYSAAQRLYGYVQGDLLWAMDMVAVGQPMGSHASARLKKVA